MRDHRQASPFAADLQFDPDVALLDDCSGTFVWTASGTGGDDVHDHATSAALTGTHGLRLLTRSTASAENDLLTLDRWLPWPTAQRLCLATRSQCPSWAGVKYWYLYLNVYNGTRQYTAALRISAATRILSYRDAAGGQTTITGATVANADAAWFNLGFCLDLDTLCYLNARANGSSYDLAGTPCHNTAATSTRGLLLRLFLYASAAGPAAMFLDNLYAGSYDGP
ncbi:MAG TPA: hypothetical protein DCQ64_12355 [Candidatus Rokubacteria bacterium]|nr:hypothetical protein [Candidatus Rokubacteria bacterium]